VRFFISPLTTLGKKQIIFSLAQLCSSLQS